MSRLSIVPSEGAHSGGGADMVGFWVGQSGLPNIGTHAAPGIEGGHWWAEELRGLAEAGSSAMEVNVKAKGRLIGEWWFGLEKENV